MDVIWHGGMKDTYLCVRDVAQAPLGEARPMQSGTSQQRVPVLDVLPFERERAMTMGELMARTGSSYGSISQTLCRLRQAGQLHTEVLPGRRGTSGREPRAYWRVA